MERFRKVIALVLCLIVVFSVMSISVSAATVSASLGYNEAENSGDYAYWNGSKVVKSSSTTKNEIKWMQAAINYCISKEGLSATKLSIDGSFGPASKKATTAFQKAAGLSADGSFGPATIKKMKSILNDGKNNSLKANSGYIKVYSNTYEIDSLNLYGSSHSLSLYVRSSSKWTVSSNAQWLQVWKSNGHINIATTYKVSTADRTGTITITNNDGVTRKIAVKQRGNTKNPNQHEHLGGHYQLYMGVTDSADLNFCSVWVCDTCGWINCDTANIWTMPN